MWTLILLQIFIFAASPPLPLPFHYLLTTSWLRIWGDCLFDCAWLMLHQKLNLVVRLRCTITVMSSVSANLDTRLRCWISQFNRLILPGVIVQITFLFMQVTELLAIEWRFVELVFCLGWGKNSGTVVYQFSSLTVRPLKICPKYHIYVPPYR